MHLRKLANQQEAYSFLPLVFIYFFSIEKIIPCKRFLSLDGKYVEVLVRMFTYNTAEAVADPAFPRWGRQPLSLERKLIIWQDFC